MSARDENGACDPGWGHVWDDAVMVAKDCQGIRRLPSGELLDVGYHAHFVGRGKL